MKAVTPAAMKDIQTGWRMSPAVEVNGFLFLTGWNGAGLDGTVSDDPAAQIETAFAQINLVLSEAGATFADIVEVTSYHVGLRDHLSIFKAAWAARMTEPYPAWTAIEVAGFATEGVIVELRVIAYAPSDPET